MVPRLKPLPELNDRSTGLSLDTGARPSDLGGDASTALAPVSEPMAPPMEKYREMTDSVANASRTINELVERNRALRASAESLVSSAVAETRDHRDRASKLEASLEALHSERARVTHENERRVRSLSEETNALKDRLETASAELHFAQQWLEYLQSHIRTHLDVALERVEALRTSQRASEHR